jgi:SAM-dependent methyltransferase
MKNFNVKDYWDSRYKNGGNSGMGSHDEPCVNFKKVFVNKIIEKYKCKTVIELGCGDGNQLGYFKNYEKYYGHDISPTIIEKNKLIYKGDDTKIFESDVNKLLNKKYDLALSLDVTYHLVGDDIFEEYMNNLFSLSDIICLFTVNTEEVGSPVHVEHRKIKDYITGNFPEYILINTEMYAETRVGFFLYEKIKNKG